MLFDKKDQNPISHRGTQSRSGLLGESQINRCTKRASEVLIQELKDKKKQSRVYDNKMFISERNLSNSMPFNKKLSVHGLTKLPRTSIRKPKPAFGTCVPRITSKLMEPNKMAFQTKMSDKV